MHCFGHVRQRRGAISASLSAVLFFLVTPSVGLAATVTGTVRDAETGDPLGFVTVQVAGTSVQGGRINRGIQCDEGGRYTLVGIPNGGYVLRASRIGYAVREDSLVVTTDKEYRHDFELTVSPVEVDGIVIEAGRFDREKEIQPGFVSVEAAELAELPGIIEGDPIRSLQLLPGVQAASDISSGLYIRGGGPDQTVVLLDGVPVYNPTHAFGFFSTFNADALDQVNLYKGAYPAKYGGRLGAVLDVNSSEGNRRELKGKAGVSTIAARVTVEGPVAGGSWLVGGRRTYLEPLLNALSKPESPLPSYYFYDLNAKLTSAPADHGRLVLSGYLGRDNVDFELDEDSELKMIWGNTILTAAYDAPIGETLMGQIKFALSRYSSFTDVRIFTTPLSIDNQLQDITFHSGLTWLAGPAHRISAGIEGTEYFVSYRQNFNLENSLDYRRKTYEASGFVEDEWSFADGTALRGGLRLRYLDDGGRLLLEPRLSGVRPLSGQVKLKFGAGVYNQYLQLVSTEGFSAGDFYVPIDETTQPSQSWQSVLGFEWEPVRRYKFSAEGYFTGLRDLVMLDTNSPPEETGLTAEEIFYTGGDGYQTGVEFYAERRVGNLTGWVGYTLGWTRRQFAELNQGETFPPKYDRRHDLSAVASYIRGKWKVGANFVYATGQAFTPAAAWWLVENPVTEDRSPWLLPADRNSSRLLPYHRLDVSAKRDIHIFGKPAELQIQIFNLYSRRNDWFVQYDYEDLDVKPEVFHQLPIIPSIGLNFEF
jgi:hypothetical protein